MSGKFTPRVCCSCSKKSLCKTSKCECRAAASGCGTGCGCAASKCSNRGVLSIKVDDSLQQKVASDLVHVSDASQTEKAIVTSQSAEVDNHCARIRKPLSEIGNTLVISSPIKPDQKMRGNITVTLVDIVDPSFSVPEIAESPKKNIQSLSGKYSYKVNQGPSDQQSQKQILKQ
ncbi:kinesin-like protein KIN-4C [Hevea brasiliensis]|uniref:kinesin-like protein KIN-4C n=1 Tax=Hevea brasiliensis TaxID=3981 RepID=UPI0025FDD566|nr:kinesin-like protein KIN-4C [Hevea brasiliensis]